MKLNLVLTAALFAIAAHALPSIVPGLEPINPLVARVDGQPLAPEDPGSHPGESPSVPNAEEEDGSRIEPSLSESEPNVEVRKLTLQELEAILRWTKLPTGTKIPAAKDIQDLNNKIDLVTSEIWVNHKDKEYTIVWTNNMKAVATNGLFELPEAPNAPAKGGFKVVVKDWYQRFQQSIGMGKPYPNPPAPLKPTSLTRQQAATRKSLEGQAWRLAIRDNYKVRYMDISNEVPYDHDMSDADVLSWFGDTITKRDISPHLRDRSVISAVAIAEQNSSSDQQNAHSSTAAQFQIYINAFETVQNNISDLLWPVFNTVLNGTSDSIFVDIAWSIYSDLTGSTTYIPGPFTNGMNCINWMESQLFNSTNNTTNHADQLARANILLEFYNDVWAQASAAANQTGLLDYLAAFSSLLATNDTSIVPPGFMTEATTNVNDNYFTSYKTNLPSR